MICPENNFESGFTGLQRTSSFLAQCLFIEYYFLPFFSPLRNASAKVLAMKVACNNKLPTQTNDVIVNPENPVNPDSKISCSAHNFHRRMDENGSHLNFQCYTATLL